MKRVRPTSSKGCVTGGWEEAAHGDVIDKSKSYLVGWRNVEVKRQLAGAGYDIVVCPGQRYYLDMSQSIEWDEPGAGWAGWSGPRETYDFDPVKGWTPDQLAALLGRAGLHLVRADDRPRDLRPSRLPAPFRHRRDRLDRTGPEVVAPLQRALRPDADLVRLLGRLGRLTGGAGHDWNPASNLLTGAMPPALPDLPVTAVLPSLLDAWRPARTPCWSRRPAPARRRWCRWPCSTNPG